MDCCIGAWGQNGCASLHHQPAQRLWLNAPHIQWPHCVQIGEILCYLWNLPQVGAIRLLCTSAVLALATLWLPDDLGMLCFSGSSCVRRHGVSLLPVLQ